MIEQQHFCQHCGLKTTKATDLIKAGKGCSSCGKSNYRCPRCGMPMKVRKINSPSSPIRHPSYPVGGTKEPIANVSLLRSHSEREVKVDRK